MPKGQKKKKAGAAVTAKDAKRRPGFSYSMTERNAFPSPQFLSTKRFKIKLLSGSNPNADTLTFVLRTHPHELVRLLPQPIRIKYVATRANPNAANQGAAARLNLISSSGVANNPRTYIDPYTASSCFFSSAEVVLDNYDVTANLPSLGGGMRGFYEQAIKSFMPQDAKNRVYGSDLTIPNEGVRTALASPEMVEAFKSLDFNAADRAVPRTIALSMDSTPLLGPSRNYQLSTLQGRDPPDTFSYLPPQTSLLIRLFRQRPDHQQVEQVDDTNRSDTDYFKHANLTHDPTDVKFDIKSIYLMAESTRVAPKAMEKLMANYARSQLHFLMDVAVPSYQHLPAGISEGEVTFMLERGTKLVYFFFVTEHQLFQNETSKKNCSFRTVIPKSLKRIRFFYGADELHFDGGLGDLQGTNVAGNLDVLTFLTYLRQRDWVDERYPDLFPRANEYGYRSFFPLDLTAMDTSEGGRRELRVDLKFVDAGCEAGLLAASIRVMEGDMRRAVEAGGEPKWKMVPNVAAEAGGNV